MIRESVSEFVANDCWGYPKFVHIEDLYKEGYLTPENEKLLIRFYIRAPLYCQQSRDQKHYIAQLEAKIHSLSENVSKYEKACSEKGISVNIPSPEGSKKPRVSPSQKESAPLEEEKRPPVPSPAPHKPIEPVIELPPEHFDTNEENKMVSLEDMIKNIEIDPHSESDREGDIRSNEENQSSDEEGKAEPNQNNQLLMQFEENLNNLSEPCSENSKTSGIPFNSIT